MKIILLFLIMTSSAYADCVGELGNLAIGVKLNGIITEKLYGEGSEFKGKNPSADEVCKVVLDEGSIKDSVAAKNKIIKVIRNDLKTKKKTDASFLSDFSNDDASEFMTEPQICNAFENEAGKQADNLEVSYGEIRSLSKVDYLNGSLENGCKKVVDFVKKKRESQKSEAEKVSHRDPPGEEIAPAEDEKPVTQKSFFKEEGVRQKTGDIQRARTKSHNSAGASASSQ